MTDKGITYREMIGFDLPVIVSIEREVYRGDAWTMSQFKEELAAVPKNRYYIVAQNDSNEIVGYAGAFSPDMNLDADVLTLTVTPEYRRQGIGRALLNMVIEWAERRKAPNIFLEVREGNIEASPLYVGAGFHAISTRSNYYSLGVNAVIMKKELA